MKPISNFSIRTILGGYDNNLSYIITCNRSREQVIIDAGIEFKLISKYILKEPTAILITHTHKDHILHLDQYAKNYQSSFIIGHPISADKFLNTHYRVIRHNEIFKIGDLAFTAIHTPGHYVDSICYQLSPALFTGDTMFVGRTGRVINAGSNVEELYDSVYNKILNLPSNIRIYPGHHYGEEMSITLSENINISLLLQAENFLDFSKRMDHYEKNRTPDN